MVACLCAGHFFAFVDRFLASAALSSIKGAFGLGDGAMGALIGPAFALAYMAGGIIYVAFGLSADGRAIRGGILLWTTGECICGLAPGAVAFGLGQIAIGMGQAIFIPSALYAVVNAGDRVGGRVSLFTASSTLGRSLAVLCAGALLSLFARATIPEEDAWRLLYFIAAAANIVLLSWMPSSVNLAAPEAGERNASAMGWLFRDGHEALWIMAIALPGLILIQAVAAWMPTLFARGFGHSPAQAATLIGMVTLATAPSAQLFWGRCFDRWPWLSRRPVTAISAFAIAAAFSVVILTGLRSAVAMLVMLGLSNLLLAAASLIGIAALQLRVPTYHRAAVNAFYLVLVTVLGAGIGPYFVGVLSQARGAAPWGLAHALGTVALVVAAAALLILVARKSARVQCSPLPSLS